MQVGVRGGMEEISSVEILLKCDSQRKEVRSYFFVIYLIHLQLQLPARYSNLMYMYIELDISLHNNNNI
jgi:hypothetical protein